MLIREYINLTNMKIILSTLFLLSTVFSFGNVDFTFNITVKNNKGGNLSGARVVLIETVTKEAKLAITGSDGKVQFKLISGKKWSVNVKEMKRVKFIELPVSGKGSSSMIITYNLKDWKRLNRIPTDRSKIEFSKINQYNLKKTKRPKTGKSFVIINLKKLDKSPLKNFPVNLTCYNTKTQFIGQTSKKGLATFEVPNNEDYEIDIEGNTNISYIDLGPRSGLHKKQFTYQPLQIKEHTVNDTITQEIPGNDDGLASTGRSFLRLQVSNFNSSEMKGKTVYLKMLHGNKVYKAKIRKEGEALFMLPLHRQYMIETKISKAIDIVDFMDKPIRAISRSIQQFHLETEASISKKLSMLPTSSNDYVVKSFHKFIKKTYPEPSKEMGLYVKWANPTVNENSKEALLEVGFNTKSLKNLMKEKVKLQPHDPLNLSFVIDVSGSMAGADKIIGVKNALKNLLKDLSPNDIVSIITFSNEASLVIPPQTMQNQELIYDIIDDLQAGGMTNIYSGLMMGYKALEKMKVHKGTNRLILLSDGYGSTPITKIINDSRKYNEKGLECSAIGVGSGFNNALMSQLASVGGGLIHFTGSKDEIGEIFKKELWSIIHPVAKEVVLELKYQNKLIYKQLYGHKSTTKEGVTIAKIDNIYSGLNKLLLVKFDLINPTKSIEKSPVIVTLSYKNPSNGSKNKIIEKKALKWNPATGKTEFIIEANYKKVLCIATLNQGLKVMADLHARGKSKAAQAELKKTKQRIIKIYPNTKDTDVVELLQTIENYISTFNFLFNAR